MDKPIAASLAEVLAIYTIADALEVPVFSSSSLRWLPGIQSAKKMAPAVGASVTSPCPFETQFRPRPDLYHCKQTSDMSIVRNKEWSLLASLRVWLVDGVHGVEMLYTCLGCGCKTVQRTAAEDVDVCVGTWNDGRVGIYRGSRTSSNYGGTVFFDGKAPATIGNSDGGCEQPTH